MPVKITPLPSSKFLSSVDILRGDYDYLILQYRVSDFPEGITIRKRLG